MCSYQSLIDFSLDLADVARMNDIIDLRNENARRIAKSREGK